MFENDNGATIYYLPGTTNWANPWGGRPAVLFSPQVRNDDSFGVQSGCFGFNFTNAGNPVVVVEACADLVGPDWSPVATNTFVGGSSSFEDPQWMNFPCRFYHFRMPR